MSALLRPEIKGACPGALRPMQSGDGLIVRVRPRAGTLAFTQVRAVADAAMRFGNGEIDVTNRANLQLRGITAEALVGVQGALAAVGLLDHDAAAEAVRNIMVNPLSGGVDGPARSIARELEARLACERVLWRLPAKFGFVVDDGDQLSLDDVSGDLYLRALDHAGERWGLAAFGPHGLRWIGAVARADAAGATAAAAAEFLTRLEAGSRQRLRSLPDRVVSDIASRLGIAPLDHEPVLPMLRPRLGVVGRAVGVGAPFGRLGATTLIALIDEAATFGIDQVSVAPWRALYFACADAATAQAMVGQSERLGLIVRDDDPVARIDCCTGAPGCGCAGLDTRAAARSLASMLGFLDGIGTAHVSGCSKGCARSARADVVLIGGERDFGVVRNGRADDVPAGRVPPSLAGLRELLDG